MNKAEYLNRSSSTTDYQKKYRQYKVLLLALFSLILMISGVQCRTTGPIHPEYLKRVRFWEIWGYLMKGEEKRLNGSEPFTDIAYFCASIDSKGKLVGQCSRPELQWKRKRQPRVHFTVAVLSNQTLMHFSLNPNLPIRNTLIADITLASQQFDGAQIDFESVNKEDAPNFLEFLKELKKSLGKDKILSVALPPRQKKVEDAFDYEAIASIADRVVVMAYDQHWSTGTPGPVASLPWCADVARYAQSTIPKKKLIMGLPLYGRAWQVKHLNRAIRHQDLKEIMEKSHTRPKYEDNKGLSMEYEERIAVKVFFDDQSTLMEKLHMYRSLGIYSVSFWRIGQGPPSLWRYIVPARKKIQRPVEPK